MVKKGISIVKHCFIDAIQVALRSSLWLMKFMIPTTFLVAMLDYFGIIEMISTFIEPIFMYAGLDARGVLVFITAIFASIYSAIAVIATLGVDYRMVVILSSMILIAHNIIVESTIQKKTGYSYIGAAALRILTAFGVGIVLNTMLPQNLEGNLILSAPMQSENLTFWGAIKAWGWSVVVLAVKMTLFIYLLNALQNILREFKILDVLIKPFTYLMRFMGLSDTVTFLWLVANTLGLAYGGAVMIEGAKSGEVEQEDMNLLNTSIGITHSLVEDTILLNMVGVPVLLLVLPRMVCSILFVWMQRGINCLVRRENMAKKAV
ncbi:MAG: hypothetical protein R3Y50_08110 [Rikenellaceae bacterium]